MFGQAIALWLTDFLSPAVQPLFLKLALVTRWTIALAGVVGLTALIYYAGVPRVWGVEVEARGLLRAREAGRATLPGAIVATTMWFVTTLVFGWYVTRFANYNQIYGSLGAAIALLFWLFLVFLSVLCGAEFNAEWQQRRLAGRTRG
jgi:membrane protein